MVGMLGAIEETIGKPATVIQSPSDPDAHLYYRYYLATIVGGKHLCVVVKIKDEDAFILTAYLINTVKKGDVKWPRKP